MRHWSTWVRFIYEAIRVLVKASGDKVIIYDKKGNCAAKHPRCRFKGQHSTLPEHIPEKHADYLMWSSGYFMRQAKNIGPAAEQVIKEVLCSREFEVQSYRSCVGILRLAKKYGPFLEKACQQASESRAFSYKAVSTIVRTMKEASEDLVTDDDATGDEQQDLSTLYCIRKAGDDQ